ncbi:MAG: prepilin-type N-terminal cleavage/methylation domain-containing protein [Planctomycetota bacterium]|jgi:prepilin-type N-terminal cleavage/methylation domain-containing protein|nr:prepilin-type N-terminal cleavage/methylation domain-containing protein [Planctomycetota bacterium]
MRRSGFTLVEILVVIGLMAVVMGIAWAGVVGSRRTAGLVGAAELTADLVRQAHHTAQSTAAPVRLRLDKAARTISGVSHIPLVGQSFEHWYWPVDSTRNPGELGPPRGVDSSDLEQVPGASGFGFVLNNHFRSPSLSDPSLQALELPTRQPLMRSQGDGFYASVLIRPPMVTASDCDPLNPNQLPVLMLAKDGVLDPDDDDAFFGLYLEGLESHAQAQPREDGSMIDVYVHQWVPKAWIRTGSGAITMIRGRHLALGSAHLTALDEDSQGPLIGNKWVELGLLYDGQALVLTQNGSEVGRTSLNTTDPRPTASGQQLNPGPIDPLNIYAGTGLNDPDFKLYFGVQQRATDSAPVNGSGLIDEIRLFRIGVDRPAKLPSNVELDADYEIIIAADTAGGTSLTDPTQTGATPPNIILRSTTDGTTATLSVDASGHVTTAFQTQ